MGRILQLPLFLLSSGLLWFGASIQLDLSHTPSRDTYVAEEDVVTESIDPSEEDSVPPRGRMDGFIQLDETEVRQRGSLCLDGQMPGFHYAPATDASASNKWVLAFDGGGWCRTPEDCAVRTKNPSFREDQDIKLEFSMMNSPEFNGYNHVIFLYCDGGLFSGDAEYPLVVTDPDDAAGLRKITLYFRGRRILDHIMDTLKKKYAFSSATEVLLTGGSAGGLATLLQADYMASQMPASVSKFRAAPQSGLWVYGLGLRSTEINPTQDTEENKGMVEMHNMVLPANCKKALPPAEQYRCVFADYAYQYTTTPTFVMQALDQFIALHTADECGDGTQCMLSSNSTMHCIVTHLNETSCSHDAAQRLNVALDGIVNNLKSTDKYNRPGEGGFISTCNLHGFYYEDEFYRYAKNGVTMAEAVGAWWRSPDKAQARWWMPCTLNDEPPYQCENSCSFVGEHTGSR